MKAFKLLIKIAISAGLIALILHAVDARGVAAQLAKVTPAGMLLAIAIALSISVLQTLRWLAVMKAHGTALRFNAALRITLIGYFFNQALPSAVGGDAVRIWCACRGGMSFSAAAHTVIIDRVLTLLSLLLLIALSLPWLFDLVTDARARWALVGILSAGAVGFGVFLGLKTLPQRILKWQVGRAVITLSALARRVMSAPRYALPAIGFSLLGFVATAAIVFCLARAMQVEISFASCLLLLPLVILATVVPISIAGWGVREGAMVVAMGLIGVPASAAFAISVLLGLALAAAGLPGSVLWLLSGYSLRNIAQRPDSAAAAPIGRFK